MIVKNGQLLLIIKLLEKTGFIN